jgi:hypothetical protein
MSIYVGKSDIPGALEERRKMIEAVSKYWKERGYSIDVLFKGNAGKCLVSARHVAVRNLELESFVKLANGMGLVAFSLEYPEDEYVTYSPAKNLLLKPRLRDGGKFKLANPSKWEGSKLSEIRTNDIFANKSSKNLVDFHHEKWEEIPGNKARCDWSEPLKTFGNAKGYYFWLMSLFVAHGVLCKDFHATKNKAKGSERFFQETVMPAIEKVEEVFGKKPLIYQFQWEDGFDIFPTIDR